MKFVSIFLMVIICALLSLSRKTVLVRIYDCIRELFLRAVVPMGLIC